jgi:hypothetical protein
VQAHRVVRPRGSHIVHTIVSQIAVRLSALCAGRPLPTGRFLVFIYVRGCVDPRAHTEPERNELNETYSDLIGNLTRDPPTCATVPQPTTLWRTTSIVILTEQSSLIARMDIRKEKSLNKAMNLPQPLASLSDVW